MSPTQVKKLEEKVNRLEKLVIAHIRQEREIDWIDDPKIVKKLDEIAEQEVSIPESRANL